MGCVSSKSEDENGPKKMKMNNNNDNNNKNNNTNNKSDGKNKETDWEKEKAKLNPEDFMVRKLNGQTIVKEPGSINGQQFIIEDCVDCDIFVCDYSASVTIDNCTNCRFFIGPVESSIFIRDCKNCKGIIACRQWRTRDCENVDVLLYSLTQPIIESSSKMRFGCFQYNYPGLSEQFQKANLNIFVNCWSAMYDFTPGKTNWEYLPKEEITDNFLKPLPISVLPEGFIKGSAIPRTWGNRPLPSSQSCLVVFFSTQKEKVVDFCNSVAKIEEGKLVVIQIAEKQIPPETLQNIKNPALLKAPAIAIEINGDDVVSKIQKYATEFATQHQESADNIMYISPTSEAAQEQVSKIFEQVQVNIEI